MVRIKTEEEFYKEYGSDWRNKIGWNPNGEMDYLLGSIYPEIRYRIDSWTLKGDDFVPYEIELEGPVRVISNGLFA